MSQFQNLPVLGLRSFVNIGSLSGAVGGSVAASVEGKGKVMNLRTEKHFMFCHASLTR